MNKNGTHTDHAPEKIPFPAAETEAGKCIEDIHEYPNLQSGDQMKEPSFFPTLGRQHFLCVSQAPDHTYDVERK
jgi:hypothetical protein